MLERNALHITQMKDTRNTSSVCITVIQVYCVIHYLLKLEIEYCVNCLP